MWAIMGRLRLAHILCSDVGYNGMSKTGTYIFSVVMWAIMGRLRLAHTYSL